MKNFKQWNRLLEYKGSYEGPEGPYHSKKRKGFTEGEAEEFQGNNDAMVGMTEDDLAEKRTGIRHNPINQKGSLWTRFKKKLQMEDEDPTPDELAKATICKKTDGKEVLDELGESEEKIHKGPYNMADQAGQALRGHGYKYSHSTDNEGKKVDMTHSTARHHHFAHSTKPAMKVSYHRGLYYNVPAHKVVADAIKEAKIEKKPWRVIDMT